MADPGQVYHNSGTPPLIYYMGKAYIGGSVSYVSNQNETSDPIDTIDNATEDEE